MAFATATRPANPAPEDSAESILYPSKAELLSALPAELSKLSPVKSWASLAMSSGLSLLAVGLGTLIPRVDLVHESSSLSSRTKIKF